MLRKPETDTTIVLFHIFLILVTNKTGMCVKMPENSIFSIAAYLRAANALVECYLVKSFQFGFALCKVLLSLRIFIPEHKINRKKTTKLKSGKK